MLVYNVYSTNICKSFNLDGKSIWLITSRKSPEGSFLWKKIVCITTQCSTNYVCILKYNSQAKISKNESWNKFIWEKTVGKLDW